MIEGFTLIQLGNSFGVDSCEYIAELIKEKSSEDLWSCDFGGIFNQRKKEEIPKSITFLLDSIMEKNVKELILSKNAIGLVAVESMSQYLISTSALESLDLSDCGMSGEATEILVNSLKQNEGMKLKTLKIGKNKQGDSGAVALSSYFDTYDYLETLEIQGCRITSEGSQALFTSLLPHAKNGTLIHLDYYDNSAKSDEAV